MATNIPPHNLAETIDAVKLMMDNPEVTTVNLWKFFLDQTFQLVVWSWVNLVLHRAYKL